MGNILNDSELTELQKAIKDSINNIRSSVAYGSHENLFASNMNFIEYDLHLEELMKTHLEQDNSYSYFSLVFTQEFQDENQKITAVKQKFQDIADNIQNPPLTTELIKKYNATKIDEHFDDTQNDFQENRQKYKDFVKIIWAKAEVIGCFFHDDIKTLKCMQSKTGILSQPVFDISSSNKPCSNCNSLCMNKCHDNYPNLCLHNFAITLELETKFQCTTNGQNVIEFELPISNETIENPIAVVLEIINHSSYNLPKVLLAGSLNSTIDYVERTNTISFNNVQNYYINFNNYYTQDQTQFITIPSNVIQANSTFHLWVFDLSDQELNFRLTYYNNDKPYGFCNYDTCSSHGQCNKTDESNYNFCNCSSLYYGSTCRQKFDYLLPNSEMTLKTDLYDQLIEINQKIPVYKVITIPTLKENEYYNVMFYLENGNTAKGNVNIILVQDNVFGNLKKKITHQYYLPDDQIGSQQTIYSNLYATFQLKSGTYLWKFEQTSSDASQTKIIYEIYKQIKDTTTDDNDNDDSPNTEEPTSDDTNESVPDTSLSGGAIAGIAAGCSAYVLIYVGIIVFVQYSKKRQERLRRQQQERQRIERERREQEEQERENQQNNSNHQNLPRAQSLNLIQLNNNNDNLEANSMNILFEEANDGLPPVYVFDPHMQQFRQNNPDDKQIVLVNQSHLQSFINRDQICSICIDEQSQDQYIKLECGHYFHKECLKLLIRATKLCPNCRAKITESKLQPLLI